MTGDNRKAKPDYGWVWKWDTKGKEGHPFILGCHFSLTRSAVWHQIQEVFPINSGETPKQWRERMRRKGLRVVLAMVVEVNPSDANNPVRA